jgi:putative transposase
MEKRRDRFRLYPTKAQEQLLAKMFGCTRLVYNHYLGQQKEFYEKNKDLIKEKKIKSKTWIDHCKDLTNLKTKEEFHFLNEVDSNALQQSIRNLDNSYQRFFKGLARHPKFKKKKSNRLSYTTIGVKIKGNKIQIPKFKGGIKFVQHRPLDGQIKSAVIIKEPSGKYFISVLTEFNPVQLPPTNGEVGIDLGLRDFVYFSSEERVENPKFYGQMESTKQR